VGPAVEQSLLKALAESQQLVADHPTIPHYACSRALILAKLGVVCWNTGRLAEAEDYFQGALETQAAAIAEFLDLPSHNRVLLEFMRLRLGQICFERCRREDDRDAWDKSRRLLETCLKNLRELVTRPELAEDRLDQSSLPVARGTLSRVHDQISQNEEAQSAGS
jgi:hypothetical protein